MVPIRYGLLTKSILMPIIVDMSIDLLDLQRDEEENNEPEIIEAQVVPSESVAVINTKQEYVDAAEKQRRIRQLELAKWAEERRIISDAPPTPQQLQRIAIRLRKGYTILKAIRRICSYTTWCKWRDEYPEVLALEEQARAERIEILMEKQREVAEQEGREKMGQLGRDKMRIDTYQSEIDRLDRLTEIRNKKNAGIGPGGITPIQINFAFGKKKQ